MDNLHTKQFKNKHNELEMGFNCHERCLGRDDSIIYIHVNDASMSLDKKEMIELHEHLTHLIEVKKKVDNKERIAELQRRKDRLLLSISDIDDELKELE